MRVRQLVNSCRPSARNGVTEASVKLEQSSFEVAPTTGITYLQFPIQVCFSATLPKLVFPSLSLSADEETFSSCSFS